MLENTEEIELIGLLNKIKEMKTDGSRIVQICATKIGSSYELLYTFGIDYDIKHVKVIIQPGEHVPSITDIFPASQASFATVRRFISLVIFRYLSSLILSPLILYKNTTANNWMLTTNDALWAGEGRFWGSNQQSQPNYSPGDKRLVVEKYSDATGGDSYYIVDNKVVGFRHRLDCNDSSFYSGNVSYSAAVNTTNYTFGRMLFPQKTASAVDWQGKVGGYARDLKIWHVCDKVEYDEEYQNIFYIPAKPIDKRYFTSVLSTMNVFDGELITNVEADSMYRSDYTTQASAYSGYGCAEGTKVQKQRMYFDYYDNKIFKLKPTDYLNLGASQALGETILNGDGLPICSVYQSGQVEFTVEVTDRAMVVISNGKFNHLYDYGDAYSENILAKETVDTSHKFVINDVNKDDVLYLKCLPLDVTNVKVSIVGEIKNLEIN